VLGLFSGILLLGERAQWTDWSALAAVLLAMGTVLLPSRRR
jgi:threonine/homoserine efflux transporter RhtA